MVTTNHTQKNPIGQLIDAMKAGETYDIPADRTPRIWQDICMAEYRKKHRLAAGSYFTFLVSAGVGSGKTILAALIAAYLLNKKSVNQIIFVCPNRAIRKRTIEVFRELNIHLVQWNRHHHEDCRIGDADGIVLTYPALSANVELLGRLCDSSKTMVIFDEIHHLGDQLDWGEKTETAFRYRAACVLGLTGTPFRADNREIKFVEYEPQMERGLKIFRADYTYTLGKAILDGVCRRPIFHWLDAEVRVTMPDRSKRVVRMDDDDLPVSVRNRRLNGAVLAGSNSRAIALKKVVEYCRRTRKKLIIFVGGDTTRKDGGGVRDATEFLPCELRGLGVRPREVCVVTADDKHAQAKLKAFGTSEASILIAVNMVSEGVDIPPLSVALFLTSITSILTTIQRIGRVLRGQGEAHIFMFGDSRYKEVGALIEAQIDHEIELGHVPVAAPVKGIGDGDRADIEPSSIGLTCEERSVTINGVEYPYGLQIQKKYQEIVASRGFPEGQAFFAVILPLIHEGAFGPIPTMLAGEDGQP